MSKAQDFINELVELDELKELDSKVECKITLVGSSADYIKTAISIAEYIASITFKDLSVFKEGLIGFVVHIKDATFDKALTDKYNIEVKYDITFNKDQVIDLYFKPPFREVIVDRVKSYITSGKLPVRTYLNCI